MAANVSQSLLPCSILRHYRTLPDLRLHLLSLRRYRPTAASVHWPHRRHLIRRGLHLRIHILRSSCLW